MPRRSEACHAAVGGDDADQHGDDLLRDTQRGDQPVESGEHEFGRGVEEGIRPQRSADLPHHDPRGHPAPHDVPDDDEDRPVVQWEHANQSPPTSALPAAGA